MTPAVKKAKQAKIPHFVHEYDHDPFTQSFGLEAAEKLNLDPEQVFKTLVVSAGKGFVVTVLPVCQKLDLKQLAKVANVKKASMADVKIVERMTGYVVGGVSPLGQKKQLPTVIDESAQYFDVIYVSAGRRGLDIELSPFDLATLTRATFAPITR